MSETGKFSHPLTIISYVTYNILGNLAEWPDFVEFTEEYDVIMHA